MCENFKAGATHPIRALREPNHLAAHHRGSSESERLEAFAILLKKMKEKLSGELKPSPLSERCLARMDLSNEDPTFGKQSTSGAPTDAPMSQR